MSDDQFLQGTWAKLSEVAVKGAQYNSRERQPHPKCLQGTRVDLLKYIHGFLDNTEKNQLIWLHGTAGVGKSAVAFTVADKMRGLKVREETNVEKRLAGTFFFSRKHTKRCTTGYFFATLVYQLATNFPSIRNDVNRTIRDNPALLDPDTPLCDQMEALFLQPLRWLRLRLRGCPPLSFVVDALDECSSQPELTDLILSLAQALREPDLPVTHILLTSRSESHISKIFQNDEVRPLVREIPVRTSGEGGVISLDGADVDNDICTFLRHSFVELGSRHPDFPQPSEVDVAKLATRAGRRFIVASTMMKFIIDHEDSDPHDRLQLMLELTSELLPGTEVYRLYDCILSTCAKPERAHLHLCVVAALADPLPISQIAKLLGPGLGRDVETTLVQLRSFMDVPTDTSLPVNIYHSSVRDYVSDPSNCSLPRAHDMSTVHSLLAGSALRLMMKELQESSTLLDALLELKKQSQAMKREDPHKLKDSLAFLLRPPEPLSVLIAMLWLRGHRGSNLRFWIETLDGRAWLRTQQGEVWLTTRRGKSWLQIQGGQVWLQMQGGKDWLQTQGGKDWLQICQESWLLTGEACIWVCFKPATRDYLHNRVMRFPQDKLKTLEGCAWLETEEGQGWLETQDGCIWLQTQGGQEWLQILGGQEWLKSRSGRDWLQSRSGRGWLQTPGGRGWLQTHGGREWLRTPCGRGWLKTPGMRAWLQTLGVQAWLQTSRGQAWLETPRGRAWLETPLVRDWLQSPGGRAWLQAPRGRDWLQTPDGRNWLRTLRGQDWLRTQRGRERLQTPHKKAWLQTQSGRDWLQTSGGRDWLQALGRRDWLQTQRGKHWLQTQRGQDWLRTQLGREWLQTKGGEGWLETKGGKDWLQVQLGKGWLKTWHGRLWLRTQPGQQWLQTQSRQTLRENDWLQTLSIQTPHKHDWLQTPHGRDWLATQRGHDWLQTKCGKNWLQTNCGQDWLATQRGHDWLRTQRGQNWLSTRPGREWLQIKGGEGWLHTKGGEDWLHTEGGEDWLQTRRGQDWLQTQRGNYWLQIERRHDWLQTRRGKDWLQTQRGQDWLQTWRGKDWLQAQHGQNWLQTPCGQDWLQTTCGQDWLQTQCGSDWLQTQCGRDWLQTACGQDWLQTQCGRDWLQTKAGEDWLQTQSGQDWLQTGGGVQNWRECPAICTWLQTKGGLDWLPTPRGRKWLQTLCGRDWLQTPHGQTWQSTPAASVWVTMEEFSSTLQAMNEYTIFPELLSLPAFQVVQQFKSLPDFLMYPVFLALMHQDRPPSTLPEDFLLSDREIIRAMNVFITFANETREQNRSASYALKYACQNWADHLLRAPNHKLNDVFQLFWNRYLLSWLERQWCLKGLRSCLVVLSQGQKLVMQVDIVDS